MNFSTAPEALREVALTPAWQELFRQVDQWVLEAQTELEESSNWLEFVETRAGIKVLRLIAGWKFQLMEQVMDLQREVDNAG